MIQQAGTGRGRRTVAGRSSTQGVLVRDLLLALAGLGLGLGAHDATAPVDAGTVVVGLLHSLHQLGELPLVLVLDHGEGDGGGRLLVHHSSQAGLALDDAVRHAHLLAEGGQPHHQLDGVHVVGDGHQLGLTVLHQGGDVVDTVLHHHGLLLVRSLGLALTSLCFRQQPLLLGGLVLRPVLQQQLEESLGSVLIQSLREAVQCRGHLQPLVQHPALPLQPHVLRPLDIPVKVCLGGRGTANTEILRALLEQRVRRLLRLRGLLDSRRGRRHALLALRGCHV
mmetsp:Transcript_10891/g.32635  ORF Transcript_10891/g.32635 Transcript_10891/m.32635 type:complete len:281 (+) Transcript_10891:387-1229(+)